VTLARNPEDQSAEGEGDEEADENQGEPDDEAEVMEQWQQRRLQKADDEGEDHSAGELEDFNDMELEDDEEE
jgi:hypothetical protein